MSGHKFPIEASHIKMFAHAIGDGNPMYHDADYAARSKQRTIIAPPTFLKANHHFDPESNLRPKLDQAWRGSGKYATTQVQQGAKDRLAPKPELLHAEQHFEYHRHLRVGDVLTPTTREGKTWEKQGKRSGKLIFSETITEHRDQNGQLVVTETSVGVVTEHVIEQ